jgi:membrane protein
MSRLTSSPILSICLALGSLWAVSFVGRAIVQAVNRMYEVEDRRPAWQRFLLPLLFSLGAALLFIAALAFLVFGSSMSVGVGSLLGSGAAGWWVWSILRWPLLVLLAFLGFGVTYYFAPDVEVRAPFISIGAALATGAWIIFSVGFSLVLNSFAQFLISPLYGWFTGLIVLLMYLYWSSVILLFGVEINRVIKEAEEGVASTSDGAASTSARTRGA